MEIDRLTRYCNENFRGSVLRPLGGPLEAVKVGAKAAFHWFFQFWPKLEPLLAATGKLPGHYGPCLT